MKRKNSLDMLCCRKKYLNFNKSCNMWPNLHIFVHVDPNLYNQYTHWCFLKLTVYRYDLIYLHFQNTEISTTCFEMIKTNKLQSIHPLKNTRNVWHKTILLGAEKNKNFRAMFIDWIIISFDNEPSNKLQISNVLKDFNFRSCHWFLNKHSFYIISLFYIIKGSIL